MPIFDEEPDQECAPDPSKRTARRSEPTSSDFENTEETTWEEVFRTCCCHSPIAWAGILFKLFWAVFFLYFFILGLEILGDGAQVLTGCAAGALFGDDMNPISGLMIGILCTVFLQSSSTTTSIVVTLVGAGAISVNQGIYMVMGSNIGTSGACLSKSFSKTLTISAATIDRRFNILAFLAHLSTHSQHTTIRRNTFGQSPIQLLPWDKWEMATNSNEHLPVPLFMTCSTF
jgi:hypothetical protein